MFQAGGIIEWILMRFLLLSLPQQFIHRAPLNKEPNLGLMSCRTFILHWSSVPASFSSRLQGRCAARSQVYNLHHAQLISNVQQQHPAHQGLTE